MKLVVHELLTASHVTQVFTPTRPIMVEALRPHIYRHNSPSGNLKMQILDSDDNIIAESNTVAISSIGSAAFFHGPVLFNINAGLAEGEEYKFRLTSTGGYTFSEPAYCGWCNGYDLAKYDAVTTPTSNLGYPLDLEIWERRRHGN